MTNYFFDNPLERKTAPQEEDVEFLPMMSIEEDEEGQKHAIPNQVSILPLRNTVLFPGVIIPITLGREKSIKAVQEAYKKKSLVGVITQKEMSVEDPKEEDLFRIGTLARIVKMLKMPDGSNTVIIQGKARFELKEVVLETPFLTAKIAARPDKDGKNKKEFDTLISNIRELAIEGIKLSPNLPPEAGIMLRNVDNPTFLMHFVSSNSNTEVNDKQAILEQDNLTLRAKAILDHLKKEIQFLELRDQIQNKVRTDIEKQQRDYFLHQQLKTIQEELGGEGMDADIVRLREKASKMKWAKPVRDAFHKDLEKLSRINPAAAEYTVLLNYLELLLDLPWEVYSKDSFDLKSAGQILDKDHFGLEKVKDRILEYLAVLKLKGDFKSPILCFVGPPGVGKTSLGKSIANALKRSFGRMSLGGLHDEAEIRGHRKTYIGAMPGRIIQMIRKAKTSNPVIILDEVDKVGTDFRGDPSSALLEVLDPEQNNAFYDNYLELEYDLSKVLFIATANSLSTIQPALRDRMEIIELSGYSLEEKVEIANRHLIPRQRKAHGLKPAHIKIPIPVLAKLVDNYTRESGVRELERKIAAIMRFRAKEVASEEKFSPQLKLDDLVKILGQPRYDRDVINEKHPPGVAVGLAWTANGGEILFIEASLHKGKGQLTLTGNLGDVMKESATTALSYLKANASTLGIDPQVFEETNIHVHVPEGAIPKDGPSAGITMLTALASAFTGRKISNKIAMTGEITLRGKVLPVGGIKEKILAAKRAGLTEVILCEINKRDISEIKEEYITGLKIHYVDRMTEVLDIALEKK